MAQPKKQRRGFGAAKEPLKVLGTSPVTKQEVKLLEGRYGPYVADGVTNASLPKQQVLEEVTLEQALVLLAARAAAGPPARGASRARGGRPAASKAAGNASRDGAVSKPARATKATAKRSAGKKAANKSA